MGTPFLEGLAIGADVERLASYLPEEGVGLRASNQAKRVLATVPVDGCRVGARSPQP